MPAIVVQTSLQEVRILLVADRTTIGRHASRDVTLADPKVSRDHAAIRVLGGEHLIEPRRARNGVFVNGNEVFNAQVLVDGDQITVGETVLRFEAESR